MVTQTSPQRVGQETNQSEIEQLLLDLNQAGIELWVEEGRLRSRAFEGAITSALREKIRLHRDEIIAVLQQGKHDPTVMQIQPVSRTPELPLSYAQQRLWFLEELGSSAAYNMPLILEIEGKLEIAALQQTLNEIIRRHESLRTTFALQSSLPHQVIHPPAAFALPVVDLLDMACDTQTSEVQRLSEAEALKPFDLTQDLMLRAQVLQLASERYLLLMTMHHIASDGWSMGVLVKELATLYAAFCQGKPSPLPELTIQYADFAVWQRNYLQGAVLERQLSWWQQQLAGAPELLSLPIDHPRPAQQSFRGAAVSLEIESSLTQHLHELSRRQGATLYMTLLAAFQVLLHRYSGQEEIVVASPIANRNHAELEPLIGFFVNTLALRSNLAGNPTFLEVLTQVQQTTQAAYDHQELPFERLVEALRPERNLAYNPIVQVVFALQNAPMGDFELPGLQVTPADLDVKSTRFDLEFHLWERQGRLQGFCVYNRDLFDASTIERMVGHFQVLLQSIVAQPDQAIAELPLLTSSERHQLLVEWNDTAADYPKDKTIHQLFEEQVARTPDAVAVVMAEEQPHKTRNTKYEIRADLQDKQSLNRSTEAHEPLPISQSLTYQELNARANQLAHYLRSLGVGPDVLVGICVERSLEMVVGLLGILKAGGAYVPLDPTYPQERLAYMLEDANVSVLLSTVPVNASLPPTIAQVVCLDNDWSQIAIHHQDNLVGQVRSDQMAYMIYTSGSTGQPKGAIIEHQNVLALLHGFEQIAPMRDRLVGVSLCSYSFDVCVWEIFSILCFGGELHLLTPEIVIDTPRFVDYLTDHAVTSTYIPPMVLSAVIEQYQQKPERWSLDRLLVGVEPIKQGVLTKFLEATPRLRITNGYGPTECTVCSTFFPFTETTETNRLTPIGKAVANSQVYLLDAYRQLCPVGVVGELYIGGAGVGRGYAKRPELTAAKFITNPFGKGKLYRTGDLCRWLADGNLEYLGRIDQQVKVRGHRIELGEIEAVLSQHPDVEEAVVVVRAEQADNKQLMAYLVAAEADATAQSEHVTTWQSLYESTYSQPAAPSEPALNLTGWNSSYTGQPIAEAEMSEWVEQTVTDIRNLQPQRILEIGCGTGLLLARLAPTCAVYWGTDYSQQAIEQVKRLCQATTGLAHVQLAQRMADDLSSFADASFDCVIVNSVVQYFPSVDYLLRVLAEAVRVLQPGGNLYVGDVRNHCLLEAYHASIQLYQASDDLSLKELQARIQQRVLDEEELLIDPAFFQALPQHLPQIDAVQLHLKRGHAHNELTRFRYQVVLHVANVPSADKPTQARSTHQPAYQEQSWQEVGGTLATLRQRLQAEQTASTLVIRNIPNARLQQEADILQALPQQPLATVAHVHQPPTPSHASIEPEALWQLGEALGYQVQVMTTSQVGQMDALFSRQPVAPFGDSWLPQATRKPWSHYTNNPLLGKLNRTLIPQVRTFLQSKLPDYMIPSAFVLLERFPLTPNGKLDRKALPAPLTLHRANHESFVAPRTDTERSLARIWSEVLGVERIGIHDNFFHLGGHSLLATQVVSRIRQALQVQIPLRLLFEQPTIADLSDAVDHLLSTTQTKEALTIPRIERNQPLPLSYAQERLWFLDQLGGERHAYNMPMALRLYGELDITALEQSLQELVRRHESLRTTFLPITEESTSHANQAGARRLSAVQVIHPATFTLPIIDLTDLSTEAQANEEQRLIAVEMAHPFDLTTGPLFRVTLVRLRQGDGAGIQPAADESLLLLNMHHIISDGWSMEIFNRELVTLYTAFRQGKPSPLPPLAIQYADFAAWQRQQLAGEALAGQLDYWQKQLAGAPPLLTLPTDHPRPAVQSYRGSHLFFPLSPALAEDLRHLSNSAGTTLFTTCLAAFKVLLMRYSGQSDIVVGTPIANRHHLAIEPIIGFFVNTLVLRSDLAGDIAFRDLLAQVKNSTLDAYQHQDVPFEKLVETLQPVRSLSHTPLFQVMFNLLKSAAWRVELPGLRMELVTEAEFTIAKFDLTLSIIEDGNQLLAMFEYNSDLFDRTTIERMAGHFQNLLQAIADNPEQPIAQLPLLSAAERHQLLVEWNDTAADYPKDKTIHQLFEEQVARTPDAVAVVMAEEQPHKTRNTKYEIRADLQDKQSLNRSTEAHEPLPISQSLTYQELNARANQLAHYLRSLGVGPDVLVGICVERSLEMVVGLLGILKAGGAYVPLDPTYPQERLAYMLEDANVSVLLSTVPVNASLPPTIAQVVCLDNDWSQIAIHHQDNLVGQVRSDQMAYMIYTSGSTGQPKGAIIEHQNVLALLHGFEQIAPMRDRLVGVSLCSYSFDVCVWEIFSILCFGGELHLLTPEIVIDTPRFVDYLTDHAVTSTYIPPMVLSAVIEQYQQKPERWSLDRLLVGVEPIKQGVLTKFLEATPRLRITNGYGPTECTVCSTFFPFTETTETNRLTPIGKAVANSQVYLLDAYRQLCPVGVVGELYIGGAGVGRGYAKRPELTAAKFITNPFGKGKLYRTGDLCRWLADGNLEYLGRIDQQVKVRGHRIELGEIEAVLSQHPDVEEAVVVVREDRPDEKRLVAYVVKSQKPEVGCQKSSVQVIAGNEIRLLTQDSGPLTSTLRSHLQQKLPEYMIPSAFVWLDALPLTPNGKVDRKALPAPDLSTLSLKESFVPPSTPTERSLADIWSAVLGLSQIGIHDNFFHLGGHSLLATQVISRIREASAVTLPLRTLFQLPTVAALAVALVDAQIAQDLQIPSQEASEEADEMILL